MIKIVFNYASILLFFMFFISDNNFVTALAADQNPSLPVIAQAQEDESKHKEIVSYITREYGDQSIVDLGQYPTAVNMIQQIVERYRQSLEDMGYKGFRKWTFLVKTHVVNAAVYSIKFDDQKKEIYYALIVTTQIIDDCFAEFKAAQDQQTKQRWFETGKMRLMGILAHEFAHVLQKSEHLRESLDHDHQRMELNADELAVTILQKANLPINSLYLGLEAVLTEKGDQESVLDRAISTHPQDQIRLTQARMLISLKRFKNGIPDYTEDASALDGPDSTAFAREIQSFTRASAVPTATTVNATSKDEIFNSLEKFANTSGEYNICELLAEYDRFLLAYQNATLTSDEQQRFVSFMDNFSKKLIAKLAMLKYCAKNTRPTKEEREKILSALLHSFTPPSSRQQYIKNIADKVLPKVNSWSKGNEADEYLGLLLPKEDSKRWLIDKVLTVKEESYSDMQLANEAARDSITTRLESDEAIFDLFLGSRNPKCHIYMMHGNPIFIDRQHTPALVRSVDGIYFVKYIGNRIDVKKLHDDHDDNIPINDPIDLANRFDNSIYVSELKKQAQTLKILADGLKIAVGNPERIESYKKTILEIEKGIFDGKKYDFDIPTCKKITSFGAHAGLGRLAIDEKIVDVLANYGPPCRNDVNKFILDHLSAFMVASLRLDMDTDQAPHPRKINWNGVFSCMGMDKKSGNRFLARTLQSRMGSGRFWDFYFRNMHEIKSSSGFHSTPRYNYPEWLAGMEIRKGNVDYLKRLYEEEKKDPERGALFRELIGQTPYREIFVDQEMVQDLSLDHTLLQQQNCKAVSELFAHYTEVDKKWRPNYGDSSSLNPTTIRKRPADFHLSIGHFIATYIMKKNELSREEKRQAILCLLPQLPLYITFPKDDDQKYSHIFNIIHDQDPEMFPTVAKFMEEIFNLPVPVSPFLNKNHIPGRAQLIDSHYKEVASDLLDLFASRDLSAQKIQTKIDQYFPPKFMALGSKNENANSKTVELVQLCFNQLSEISKKSPQLLSLDDKLKLFDQITSFSLNGTDASDRYFHEYILPHWMEMTPAQKKLVNTIFATNSKKFHGIKTYPRVIAAVMSQEIAKIKDGCDLYFISGQSPASIDPLKTPALVKQGEVTSLVTYAGGAPNIKEFGLDPHDLRSALGTINFNSQIGHLRQDQCNFITDHLRMMNPIPVQNSIIKTLVEDLDKYLPGESSDKDTILEDIAWKLDLNEITTIDKYLTVRKTKGQVNTDETKLRMLSGLTVEIAGWSKNERVALLNYLLDPSNFEYSYVLKGITDAKKKERHASVASVASAGMAAQLIKQGADNIESEDIIEQAKNYILESTPFEKIPAIDILLHAGDPAIFDDQTAVDEVIARFLKYNPNQKKVFAAYLRSVPSHERSPSLAYLLSMHQNSDGGLKSLFEIFSTVGIKAGQLGAILGVFGREASQELADLKDKANPIDQVDKRSILDAIRKAVGDEAFRNKQFRIKKILGSASIKTVVLAEDYSTTPPREVVIHIRRPNGRKTMNTNMEAAKRFLQELRRENFEDRAATDMIDSTQSILHVVHAELEKELDPREELVNTQVAGAAYGSIDHPTTLPNGWRIAVPQYYQSYSADETVQFMQVARGIPVSKVLKEGCELFLMSMSSIDNIDPQRTPALVRSKGKFYSIQYIGTEIDKKILSVNLSELANTPLGSVMSKFNNQNTPITLSNEQCQTVSQYGGHNFQEDTDPRTQQRNQQVAPEIGETIVKISLAGLFNSCLINADPHKGNFLVNVDERIIYPIDFGQLETGTVGYNLLESDDRLRLGNFLLQFSENITADSIDDWAGDIYDASLQMMDTPAQDYARRNKESVIKALHSGWEKSQRVDPRDTGELMINTINALMGSGAKVDDKFFGMLKGLMVLSGEKYVPPAKFRQLLQEEMVNTSHPYLSARFTAAYCSRRQMRGQAMRGAAAGAAAAVNKVGRQLLNLMNISSGLPPTPNSCSPQNQNPPGP
ncbi:MAG: hypothetical protein HQK53_14385 [Oligoflexia bacterium]|nr:hypothetical protein [Oligoflexia bacterium]